jgi:hypothetical protein
MCKQEGFATRGGTHVEDMLAWMDIERQNRIY